MKKRPGLRPGLWYHYMHIFSQGVIMQFNYKHISFNLHPMVAILLMSPAMPWF